MKTSRHRQQPAQRLFHKLNDWRTFLAFGAVLVLGALLALAEDPPNLEFDSDYDNATHVYGDPCGHIEVPQRAYVVTFDDNGNKVRTRSPSHDETFSYETCDEPESDECGCNCEGGDVGLEPDPGCTDCNDPGPRPSPDPSTPNPGSSPTNLAPQRLNVGVALGKNETGAKLGKISLRPELAGQGALSITDVVTSLEPGTSPLDVTQISGTEGTLSVRQFRAHDTLIDVRETAEGGLRARAYVLGDLAPPVSAGDLYSLNAAPGSPASSITDITLARSATTGGDPALVASGTAKGEAYYAAFTAVAQPGAGQESVTYEGDKATRVLDLYEVDNLDADGWRRLQSVEIFRWDMAAGEDNSGGWVPTASELRTYRTLITNTDVLLSRQVSVGAGMPALTTSYTYEEEFVVGAFLNKAYGQLRIKQNPDGSFVRYEYDLEGRVMRIFRPWRDHGSASNTSAVVGHVEEFTYAPGPGGLETLRIEKINGMVVAQRSTATTFTATTKTVTVTNLFKRLGAGSAVVVAEAVESAEYEIPTTGEPFLTSTTDASGLKRLHRRQTGGLAANGRFSTTVAGSLTAQITIGPLNASGQAVAGRTHRRVHVTSPGHLTKASYSEIATATGLPDAVAYDLIEGTSHHYDGDERLLSVADMTTGELLEQHSYSGLSHTITDAFGQVTTQVGVYGRLAGSFTNGLATGTSSTVDMYGHTHTITNRGGRSSTTKTDMAGRVLRTSDEAGVVTEFSYPSPGVTSVTLPTGAVRVTAACLDGQTKQITGIAPSEFHTSTVNADGTITDTVHFSSATSQRWRAGDAQCRWLGSQGREPRAGQPGTDGRHPLFPR